MWVPTNEQFQRSDAFSYVFSDGWWITQVVWLMGLTAVFLTTAVVISHCKEFTTASEGDM
jgi:hypothetical protein